MGKKEKTVPKFNALLTQEELDALDSISERVLGKKNRTGIVRYWINKYKDVEGR